MGTGGDNVQANVGMQAEKLRADPVSAQVGLGSKQCRA